MAEQSPSLNFEQALSRLEEIAQSLEDQRLGLEGALCVYAEGVGLLRQCQELLGQAERKIEQLTGIDAAGQPIVKPFDDSATFSAEEATVPKAGLTRKRKSKAAPPVTNEPAPWEDHATGEDAGPAGGLF